MFLEINKKILKCFDLPYIEIPMFQLVNSMHYSVDCIQANRSNDYLLVIIDVFKGEVSSLRICWCTY